MAGKRAQRGEKDSNWRDGYFFCNFIFCFLWLLSKLQQCNLTPASAGFGFTG
jgi:hypothetical protein